ncbi:MAG: hypothetical protein J5601_00835, partial [Elusimicrobiaceae bacterium]|nr:hypothetical protein [Elusimicrobiaceae bacterium]
LILIGGLWVLSRFSPFIFSFYSELPGLMWSSFVLALFLSFQRGRDIFGKWWQALLLLPLFWIDDLLKALKIPYASWISGPFFIVLLLFLFFKKGKTAEKFVWERKTVLKRVALVGLIIGFLLIVAFGPYRFSYVMDPRMYPTISSSDSLLISRSIKGNSIERGDLVIPEIPSYDERILTSLLRVIGLPNEEIKLDGNKIYINGELFTDELPFTAKI